MNGGIKVKKGLSVKTLVETYYQSPYLDTQGICKLLDCCRATAINMKKQVKEEMHRRNEIFYDSNSVSTATAYEVWGFDINHLEEIYKKQREYGI